MNDQPMSPNRFLFAEAQYPAYVYDYNYYMAAPFSLSKADAKRAVANQKQAKVYLSDTYQVEVNPEIVEAFGFTMIWLSIKRIDKAPFHDWRELQSIKNAICGNEAEAVELYPAESRLVDSANQYHIYVLPEGKSWPFGMRCGRQVTDEQKLNEVQRPLETVETGIVGAANG